MTLVGFQCKIVMNCELLYLAWTDPSLVGNFKLDIPVKDNATTTTTKLSVLCSVLTSMMSMIPTIQVRQ